MPEYTPRIAIVGAGPAGLTLGRLLYLQGIPATIYERRPEPTAEDLAKPCGMLDLHAESGIAALRDCGLPGWSTATAGCCTTTSATTATRRARRSRATT
ncbi:hypothetical protein VTK73DRAFT_9794 [Phialemonium thermophilum]|uniref:FAD-binding domain-containing protein n=1 Tax=Phialemonium thermophilum TaxID=223376 RepID=A0ABR3W0A8_9PEZI